MSYILFFGYLILFCWLLYKIKFIRECGLSQKTIIILFLIRIVAGIINGYINLYYYPGSDVSVFHHDSILEYDLLMHDPKAYLSNIFQYNNSYTAFLDTTDSFWNNLRSDFIIKLLSIFNIFSRCNFFINTLFFNLLIFFGAVAFYRVFSTIYQNNKKLLIFAIFLLPSVIYFTSGIHRDGFIYLALGIISYHLFFLIKEKSSLLKKIIWVFIGFILIFFLRNFVLIALIPAVTAFLIVQKKQTQALFYFIVVYSVFILLFFLAAYVHPSFNLPNYVSERQIDYIEIAKQSGSAININPLFPTFRSFLNNAPQALNHSLMRPYITETHTWLSILSALEILLYELLFLLFLFFRRKNILRHPFIYFCIFFSVSMFLMIGYTIPIVGALVRYRSIYFPFLIVPLLFNIDWKGISKTYIKKKCI